MPLLARVRPFLLAALVAALLPSPLLPPARAQSAGEAGFAGYLQLLGARARREGVSEATIARMTSGLTFNPRVIAARSVPAGRLQRRLPRRRSRPIAASMSTPSGSPAAGGCSGRWRRCCPGSRRAMACPGRSCWRSGGTRRNYGSYTGDFDLARSLATLAYEGRRRDLFAGEFIALLKMVDRGVPRDAAQGQLGGRIRQSAVPAERLSAPSPPTVTATADATSGTAAPIRWPRSPTTSATPAGGGASRGECPLRFRPGSTGRRYAPAGLAQLPGRCMPVIRFGRPPSEWRRLGVTPLAPIRGGTLASLLQPDGPGTPAWLLTGNYRVILQYNCSNYYGLSVGLLADAIAR